MKNHFRLPEPTQGTHEYRKRVERGDRRGLQRILDKERRSMER